MISVLLLAGLVGSLLVLDVTRGDERPRVDTELRFSSAYEHDGQWYLPVTITNAGDRATDLLRVELVRETAQGEPEISELEYAFVAGGEQVDGIAVFDEQPTEQSITVDVTTITEP